ncbi:MAG: amidohydrolase family protein [Gemmatimonadetes bacterium]|nr:amidohydrolase family protein [Gemmatimonadota bacterium]
MPCPPDERRIHPRFYGTYPRVLGHYVRELHAFTWAAAIRQMTSLPAATIGLLDRVVLAPGMRADVVVFDTATVIDHATYEKPAELSEGIQHVLVNGTLALTNGAPTSARGGLALARSAHQPSHATSDGLVQTVTARGTVKDASGLVTIDASVSARGRLPITGTFRVSDAQGRVLYTGAALGRVETSARWGSVTGRLRTTADDAHHPFTLVVEEADPMASGTPTLTLFIDGKVAITGRLATGSVRAESKPQ